MRLDFDARQQLASVRVGTSELPGEDGDDESQAAVRPGVLYVANVEDGVVEVLTPARRESRRTVFTVADEDQPDGPTGAVDGDIDGLGTTQDLDQRHTHRQPFAVALLVLLSHLDQRGVATEAAAVQERLSV